jgi:hypothetical protein
VDGTFFGGDGEFYDNKPNQADYRDHVIFASLESKGHPKVAKDALWAGM